MTDIIIRKATLKDIESLTELIKGYREFYKRPQINDDNIKSIIKQFIEHPEQGTHLVAEKNNSLVGFVTLNPLWSTTRMSNIGLLNDLFVTPAARKDGVGKMLTEATLEFSKEIGYPLVRLLTAQDNEKAQQLYDKTGGQVPGWVVYDYDLSK